MVAKILSTSNFNSIAKSTYLILGGFFSFCQSDIDWIRELPKQKAVSSIETPRLSGLFARPQISKAAMGTKSHTLFVGEWIEFKDENQFIKKYIQFETRDGKNTVETRVGTGTFEQVGPWVLLSTEQKTNGTCVVPQALKLPLQYQWKGCDQGTIQKTNLKHKLLYHYDKVDQSLAHLQFESGYVEADFGIGWEVMEPYQESNLFRKIRAKYTKKEFQPHVYYYGRLD